MKSLKFLSNKAILSLITKTNPKRSLIDSNQIFKQHKKHFNLYYKKRSIYGNNRNSKQKNDNNTTENNKTENQTTNYNNTSNNDNISNKDTNVSNNNNTNYPESNSENSLSKEIYTLLPEDPNSFVYFDHPASDVLSYTSEKKHFESLPGESISFKITGEENQIISIDIHPNQEFTSTRAKFFYLTQGVLYERVSNNFSFGSIFKRLTSGAGLVMFKYRYPFSNGFGRVCFSEIIPSKYIALRLEDYPGDLICAKGSFLLGTSNVQLDSYITSITKSIFGGADFFMQKISGPKGAIAIIKIGGSIIKKNLRENETIIVRPGQVVMFEERVKFEAKIANSFDKLMVAGISLVNLTGPGEVILQSMDFEELVDEIKAAADSRYVSNGFGSGGRDKDVKAATEEGANENSDVKEEEDEEEEE